MAACLAALAAVSAAAHDGEMMEPKDGLALTGIGNSKFDADDFESSANLAPRMEKLYIDFDALTGHPITPAKLQQKLNDIDADGQVAQIGIDFKGYDPTTFFPMDQAITMGMHDAFLQKIADGMKQFGKPVFLVPGFEFNLVGYTPGYYPKAFRYMVDFFRVRGVDNVAWVWNPFIGDTAPTKFDAKAPSGEYLWWPGPEYVRWISANVFQATAWVNGSQDPKAVALNELVAFATAHRKPMMFSETTNKLGSGILPTSDPGAQAQANELWNDHFFHLFDFIERHPNVKGFVYISTDWSQTAAWAGWGNARVQDNAYLMQKFLDRVKSAEYGNGGDSSFHPWVPHLVQKAPPGGFVPFQVHNLPAGAHAALMISKSLAASGIPFAGGVDGAFLLGGPVFHVATVAAGPDGKVTVPATLPSTPTLSGQSFHSQWITLQGLPTPMKVEIQ